MRQTASGLDRSLSLLLRGLSGADIPVECINDAEGDNPYIGKRPIISLEKVWLPSTLRSVATEGLNVAKRASVAHAAAHLLYSTPAREVTSLKPMGIAVVSAIEDARVEYMLMKRLPGVRRWFSQAMREHAECTDIFSSMIARLAFGLLHDQIQIEDYWVNKARNLFFSVMTVSGLEDYDKYRAIASVLANDLGQMRIQFNAQTYVNPVKYRDDNSYLWNLNTQGSDPELEIDHVASLLTESTLPNPEDESKQKAKFELQSYLYPELDYRSGIERQDWCTVLESRYGKHEISNCADLTQNATYKKLRVTKNSARALGREKLFRQQEGDLLDMNAVLDTIALVKQGVMGDGDHYIRHKLRKKSMSVLLILDLSASVGNRVPGQDQTILHLEKATAMLLADFAYEQGDRVAVHGFCSDRRSGVHYYRYLDFDQPFSSSGLHALQHAGHQYSTRMGAALRHAVSFLNDADTDARSIIMMTDGAPSDIDVFDPQYLVEDARTVVRKANKNGIDIYGLVMDPTTVEQTRKIFGTSRYRIVYRAQSLPRQLESIYQQMKS
jgi:Mg-chelatase subunit ChlD